MAVVTRRLSPTVEPTQVQATATVGMTVEEYAKAVCVFGDEDVITWEGWQEMVATMLKPALKVNPPAVLEDFHQHNIAVLEVIGDIASDQSGVIDPNVFYEDGRFLMLSERVETIEGNMSPQVRGILIQHGCLE